MTQTNRAAPDHTPHLEHLRDRAKPIAYFGEARERLMRTAFALEKTYGTRHAAYLLRAMADAIESGRTPDFV